MTRPDDEKAKETGRKHSKYCLACKKTVKLARGKDDFCPACSSPLVDTYPQKALVSLAKLPTGLREKLILELIKASKRGKASVNYRKATGNQRCGACAHFQTGGAYKAAAGTCELVAGVIEATDVCDLYMAKTEKAVSDKPWSGNASRYSSTEAYCKACLIDENDGAPKTQSKCHLPVYEPSGALNRNAVHAAAARINQTSASGEAKAKAKSKLRSLYGQLGEEPPDVLKETVVAALFSVPVGIDTPEEDVEVSYSVVKANEEKRYTLGPVYAPGELDAHNETIFEEDLQAAMWDYVRKGDRTVRLQHSDKRAGEWVDLMTWPLSLKTELKMPDGTLQKVKFPPNTVFMGVLWDEATWPLVKSGKISGYSIGGTAVPAPLDDNEKTYKPVP